MINTVEHPQQQAEAENISNQMKKLRQKERVERSRVGVQALGGVWKAKRNKEQGEIERGLSHERD